MKHTAYLIVSFLLLACSLPAEAVMESITTFQTGFDTADDVSGSNYTLGTVAGQNNWYNSGSYNYSEIAADASLYYWGTSYLKFRAYSGSGMKCHSGITRSLPYDHDAAIRITMDVAADAPAGSNRQIRFSSAGLGTLFLWSKYTGGSTVYSKILAPDEATTWAGGWDDATPANNAVFPWYSTGVLEGDNGRWTHMVITITANDITYETTDYQPNPSYGTGLAYTHTFATPLDDLRSFGDLQLHGLTSGDGFSLFIDNLKIEYLANAPYQAVTFQTGFDQTDDISGMNYTLGDIDGQNGWFDINNYSLSEISDTAPIEFYSATWTPAHTGDGYLRVFSAANSGVGHDSGISAALPDRDNAYVRITGQFACVSQGGPYPVEIRSSELGTLMRWTKYSGGSAVLSYVTDPNTSHIWAGGWSSGAPTVGNTRWPGLARAKPATTTSGPYIVTLEIQVHKDRIEYDAVGHFTDGSYETATSSVYNWLTPLDDLRTFGDIQFIAINGGNYVNLLIDNLKIEYVLPLPETCGDAGTVYLTADLNQDCYVNLIDIAQFGAAFLQCSDPQQSQCDPWWK